MTGSTGSGKTTLMSWILSTIPNEKRIFTIENGCREFDLVKEDAEGNVINNVSIPLPVFLTIPSRTTIRSAFWNLP